MTQDKPSLIAKYSKMIMNYMKENKDLPKALILSSKDYQEFAESLHILGKYYSETMNLDGIEQGCFRFMGICVMNRKVVIYC